MCSLHQPLYLSSAAKWHYAYIKFLFEDLQPRTASSTMVYKIYQPCSAGLIFPCWCFCFLKEYHQSELLSQSSSCKTSFKLKTFKPICRLELSLIPVLNFMILWCQKIIYWPSAERANNNVKVSIFIAFVFAFTGKILQGW